jgi:hypothetical protein
MTTPEQLSAVISVLGDVMLEMQRRRLLARPGCSVKTREMLISKSMTDEELGTRAGKAFEAGVLHLVQIGHPGVSAFACNPTEEP